VLLVLSDIIMCRNRRWARILCWGDGRGLGELGKRQTKSSNNEDVQISLHFVITSLLALFIVVTWHL
jgi:hypothetical protein